MTHCWLWPRTPKSSSAHWISGPDPRRKWAVHSHWGMWVPCDLDAHVTQSQTIDATWLTSTLPPHPICALPALLKKFASCRWRRHLRTASLSHGLCDCLHAPPGHDSVQGRSPIAWAAQPVSNPGVKTGVFKRQWQWSLSMKGSKVCNERTGKGVMDRGRGRIA